MRPTRFSFNVKARDRPEKKATGNGQGKYHASVSKSHKQQRLDASKLQIPAKLNALCGWSRPNTLFRPSEFAEEPLPLPHRPKRLDPIERKHLIEEKLHARVKRYGTHVSSDFITIRDDYDYEKTVKYDMNFRVEPGDSPNSAFSFQRGWADSGAISLSPPGPGSEERSSSVEMAQNELLKYFAAKNDWHKRVIEKSQQQKEEEKRTAHHQKYRKRNEFTSTNKQCNRWENSLRWSAPLLGDSLENGTSPSPQKQNGSPESTRKEKQYLVFPGTNRLVRADFVSSYRVNQIWTMREKMRLDKAREAKRAKASEFAMARQKELTDKKKKDMEKKDADAARGVQGFKAKRAKKKRRRSSIFNREATIRAKLTASFEKMRKHMLEAAFEHWLFKCFKMKMQVLFTKLANFQLSVAVKQWYKFTSYERKISSLKLLRLQAMTQMESASSIREKRLRGALKLLLGNMRLVRVRKSFQKWNNFSKLHTKASKRLTLLPKGHVAHGAQLDDGERIAKELNKMEAYFVQYERLNKEKNRRVYRDRKGTLKHEYFDKKALEGDRRYRVESLKPSLLIRWM
eukprot:g1466.t1